MDKPSHEISLSRRLRWTLPATFMGFLSCLIFLLLLGMTPSNVGGVPGFLGLMVFLVLIHIDAWVLFIAPFTIFVSPASVVYRMALAPMVGGAIGLGAYGIHLVIIWLLFVEARDAGTFYGMLAIGSFPCVVSGMMVAGTMSLLRHREIYKAGL